MSQIYMVEVQVYIPPIGRDVQNQIAPESRHIGKQLQSTSDNFKFGFYYIHYTVKTQITPMASHIGIEI